MDQSILELLGQLMNKQNSPFNSQQQKAQTQQNASVSSYPPEASFNQQTQPQNNQSSTLINNLFQSLSNSNNPFQSLGGGNNMFSLLASILGKDNPLSSIMTASNKSQTTPSTAKDEILL